MFKKFLATLFIFFVFIQFTSKLGGPVYINPEEVSAIFQAPIPFTDVDENGKPEMGTYIFLKSGHPVIVMEKPEVVKQKISGN